MSEPNKALVFIISVAAAPLILYVGYLLVKDYLDKENAIHVDFREEDGKMKGYELKDGKWIEDESLRMEDDDIDDIRNKSGQL